ncbi:Alpha/beta hydrolase family protein [Planctomycetes bacterium Poly30]|uniref:Alpha/beta hydrolase family protein n=1 Tax=Saltatorellus ferox TaxID=2528018 RepID=A0A518F187_9BACT|nr:Alpha/beta hydrolase family protein [Planctomycetes bacterium Poly30]
MAQEMATKEERTWLLYPEDPARRVGVRIERPGDALEEGAAERPVVVLSHGFKGFMDWGFFPMLSTRLARAGFVVVSFNASGSGIGDDPMVMDDEEAFLRDTYTRQLEDIARVRAWARRLEGVDAGREALMGHSRGGGMSIVAAAEDPPAALVTWAAIDESDRFDDATKAHWRAEGELRVPNGRTGQVHRMSVAALDDFEEHRERLDIVAAAGRYPGPFLAIHGSKDGTVPPSAATRLAAAAPGGSALILEGADHAFDAKHPMGEVSPEALERAIAATLDHLAPLAEPPRGTASPARPQVN